MKYIIVSLALCLSACSTVTPVKRNFPKAPEELTAQCPDLKLIDPKTTKLSEVVTVVSENNGTYLDCQIKTEGWIDWYNTQKKIFDEVK